jgi:hypothetical protein
MAWTNTGGGDHGGAEWTISSNTTVGGTHTGIGIFTINGGITATVDAAGLSFKVYCIKAVVSGTIDGNGKGYVGGIAGAGSGSGIGGSGGTGQGAGGGVKGKGGAYGGNGGFGGLRKVSDIGHNRSCTLEISKTYYGYAGSDGGGNTSADGNNTGTYGSVTDTSVYAGSGGGGASGGGVGGYYQWGSFCGDYAHGAGQYAGSSGGVGGYGGGLIYIQAIQTISINIINANGSVGNAGGNGGREGYNGGGYNESATGGSGGGGGGGGGGSGGTILLYAPKVTYTTLSSSGGNGAAGGSWVNYGDYTYGSVADLGGGGGSGGRIKVFHSRPAESYLSAGTPAYAGGTKGSTSTSVDGASGTYATGATASKTADVPFEARIIYQVGGNYKKRFRVNLLS